MKKALFYEKLPDSVVHCRLCRHNCTIRPGRRGICNVRMNIDGDLFSLNYGKIVAANIDPIEKKPLYHFLPGTSSYSIAAPGCNLHCRQCQNYSISQVSPDDQLDLPVMSPEEIVRNAVNSHCASISYTYTEPTIFYEFAFDTAVLAKTAGLKNVFVTNGYIEQEPLERIAPYLDAANIDLKGFSADTYRSLFGARLEGVLESIINYRKLGIWLEITTLVIPGINDSDSELAQIAQFIAENVGADTPWHISRFHPAYKMSDLPPTLVAKVLRGVEIGQTAGLKFVYPGNIPNYSPR
jgi:pyruvate formate lyase activating enzyme